MNNYSRIATEKINSFGVMYNSDGSEKTLEQLEGGEAEKPQVPKKIEPQQPETSHEEEQKQGTIENTEGTIEKAEGSIEQPEGSIEIK